MLHFKRAVMATMALSLLASTQALAAGGSDDSNASTQSSAYVSAKSAVDGKRFQDAVPMLEKVVSAEPQNADAWNLLGYSQRRIGRFDPALKSYGTALKLQPSHLGANEYLGELYLRLGKVDKAEERLAVLDKACFFGCSEYDQLKAAIQTYKTTGKVNW